MPWHKSPVIFSECTQIWCFWRDFCLNIYWKFVQASRFGPYGRTDGRPRWRSYQLLFVCKPKLHDFVLLQHDGQLHCLDVQLCAVPTGVVDTVACWLSYVHINAICKLIVNRDSFGRKWGHLNALGLMQILFPFSPICTSIILYVWNKHRSWNMKTACRTEVWISLYALDACEFVHRAVTVCSDVSAERTAHSSGWLSCPYWCCSKLICRLYTKAEGHSTVSVAQKSLYPCCITDFLLRPIRPSPWRWKPYVRTCKTENLSLYLLFYG